MKPDYEWPLLGQGAKGAAVGLGGRATDRAADAIPIAAPFAPIASPADAAAPLLPLALDEHVELIKASLAVDAFARRRAVQIVTHGHTPESDLERTVDHLAYQAKARLDAFTEIVGRDRSMTLPADRREQCIRYVEIAGALLLALRDRLETEVSEQ